MIIQILYNYINKKKKFKDNGNNITLIDILIFLISFYACYLSWKWTCNSNKNQNIILKFIYVIIVYIFLIIEIIK